MTYAAKVIAASENESGQRLVTFEVTFPRFLLAEFNTHLIISKCSASSRAIPTEKILAIVKDRPFVPSFNKRVTGMGVGDPLTPEEQADAQARWLRARDASVEEAEAMLHIDKSRVNRMLEPYMWHTAILTGTQWRNFFGLRCPDAEPTEGFPAQLEFQIAAAMMRDAYIAAVPEQLQTGQWHLPYVTQDERDSLSSEACCFISAGRLARVSYVNHDKNETIEASMNRAHTFTESGHWSTMMHQGRAQWWAPSWSGNFYGFDQFRKLFRNENDALSQRSVDWADLIK